MKIITRIIFICILINIFSCNKKDSSSQQKDSFKIPEISDPSLSRRLKQLGSLEFENKTINLGTFKANDSIVQARYNFTNTGEVPILIESINPDCSCTDYQFTKDTIYSGKKGFVDLKYNLKDKIGEQKLYATVRANTEERFYKLTLKLNIQK